ncbi:adenylosuccinate lyase [Athalassotoga saccharophila]|uniref:adenylosuccinate lyase n=1 Tax=Athalassotoga saccharophila TaxID=1441386 RepID=UPI00137A74D9|nr:adenylosuccinate lyase [Athalassotoga saccharophila]BBJ28521.1 adenylosuccinate lyase [Athalassotoga saccharophila]
MIERYTPSCMKDLWSEERKFERWLEVEIAVMESYEEIGVIPKGYSQLARKHSRIDVEEINQIESNVNHDVIAFIKSVTSTMGDEARYFHYGLTSSDVVDTAFSIAAVRAMDLILSKMEELMSSTLTLAKNYKYTPIIGRTHGVHAEPTTFGLKVLNWYYGLERSKERLEREKENVSIGKISGAVGNYANVPVEIEEMVCKKLKLKPAKISTQILPRDLHAGYISSIAIVGGELERISTEIRNLQRTEIREVQEPFSSTQRGSSAMPHKKNPVKDERISGLSRVLRGYAISAMEDIALWHERDISHSSVERIIFPDTTSTLYFMIDELNKIINGLKIEEKKMKENIYMTGGLVFSEKVLLKLVNSGLSREEAYRIVQNASMKVWDGEERSLKEAMKKYTDIDLEDAFSLDPYLKNVDKIFERFERS